ncbi:hypothetical protein B0F90DRAFT_1774486 [Multifurca ochricompacta]|uniref:Secreted protein n=1 Tax=Multifurca ochricompacta TaxID=376703 RepID=A0AAD4LXR0_9AGAM|nr:hypothetical protein B0F90DRAFT_1774486 [Multifurca ochricompacta]
MLLIVLVFQTKIKTASTASHLTMPEPESLPLFLWFPCLGQCFLCVLWPAQCVGCPSHAGQKLKQCGQGMDEKRTEPSSRYYVMSRNRLNHTRTEPDRCVNELYCYCI